MTDFVLVLVAIILAGFGGIIIGVDIGTEDHIKIIKECQEDLPRDQYCTIIAVPENEIED